MARTPLTLPFSPNRLRTLRERRGLLQEDLAKLTVSVGYGVARSTISHLELGDRMPGPPVLKALADALEVGIDELLDNTGRKAA